MELREYMDDDDRRMHAAWIATDDVPLEDLERINVARLIKAARKIIAHDCIRPLPCPLEVVELKHALGLEPS